MTEFEFYKDLREEGETPPPPEENGVQHRLKKRPGRRKALALGLVLALVLGVVLVAAYRDGTGFDVLRRSMGYSGMRDNGDGTRGSFPYESDRNNRFALLGDRLLVASSTAIRILAGDGSEVYSRSVFLSSPCVSGNGETAVVYDAGGTTIYWLNAQGALTELSCRGVLAATMNDSGWLAVTDQAGGYKAAVSVYDPQQTLTFTFSSSERFVSDACVTPDNKRVAVVTMGQEDGAFFSNVLFYRLDSTEVSAQTPLSGYVTALACADGKLALVSDTSIDYLTAAGEAAGSYDYSTLFLRSSAVGGDGFAALLLGRYQSGTLGVVMTVDRKGTLIAAQEVDEEVLDLSAAGGYVAVLYADRLVIYTEKMETYATLETDNLRGVLMRADGSAVLLSSDSACVYVP